MFYQLETSKETIKREFESKHEAFAYAWEWLCYSVSVYGEDIVNNLELYTVSMKGKRSLIAKFFYYYSDLQY